MPSSPSAGSAPAWLVIACLVLSGCSSSTDPGSATTTTSSSAASPAAPVTPTASAPGAPGSSAAPTTGLVAGAPGATLCETQARAGDQEAVSGPTAVAEQGLTITGVRVVGRGVRLLGADAVLTSRSVDSSGSVAQLTWPFRPGEVPPESDPVSRRPLTGTTLSAGEQVAPILGLEVTRQLEADGPQQARVRRLVVDWSLPDGTTGSLDLPLDVVYRARGC